MTLTFSSMSSTRLIINHLVYCIIGVSSRHTVWLDLTESKYPGLFLAPLNFDGNPLNLLVDLSSVSLHAIGKSSFPRECPSFEYRCYDDTMLREEDIIGIMVKEYHGVFEKLDIMCSVLSLAVQNTDEYGRRHVRHVSSTVHLGLVTQCFRTTTIEGRTTTKKHNPHASLGLSLPRHNQDLPTLIETLKSQRIIEKEAFTLALDINEKHDSHLIIGDQLPQQDGEIGEIFFIKVSQGNRWTLPISSIQVDGSYSHFEAKPKPDGRAHRSVGGTVEVQRYAELDSGTNDLRGPSEHIRELAESLLLKATERKKSDVSAYRTIQNGQDVYQFSCEDQHYLPGLKITVDIDSVNGETGSFYVNPKNLFTRSKKLSPTGQPVCFLSFTETHHGSHKWMFGSSILRGRILRFDVRARTVGIFLHRDRKSSLLTSNSQALTGIDTQRLQHPSGDAVSNTGRINDRVAPRYVHHIPL